MGESVVGIGEDYILLYVLMILLLHRLHLLALLFACLVSIGKVNFGEVLDAATFCIDWSITSQHGTNSAIEVLFVRLRRTYFHYHRLHVKLRLSGLRGLIRIFPGDVSGLRNTYARSDQYCLTFWHLVADHCYLTSL